MKYFYNLLTSMVAFLILGTLSSFAETNFGTVELGKTYELTSGEYYYATFTPEKDGHLQVYSDASSTLRAFKTWKGSAKETMALAENNYVQTKLVVDKEGAGYNYEIAVKKGVTYYLCCYTISTDLFHVTVKMEPKDLKYLGPTVEDGSSISATGTTSVSFQFNRPVVCSSAAIIYGDNQRESVPSRSSSYACTVSADLKTALVNLASEGKIKLGDEFTVEIKNVTEDMEDATEGETPLVYGDVSVKLKVGELPAMLESVTLDGVPVTNSTKFLTYYAEGKGKLVLTFTKEMSDEYGSATLRFGDSDKQSTGGYYQEVDGSDGGFTMTIKGKQVILDFSGRNRRISDMVSSTESDREDAYTKINLEIAQLRSIDGVKPYSTSNSGKFNYSFELDVPEVNVSSDFTPANGSSIKDKDEIEIWITDANQIKFDGVNFQYVDENNETQIVTVTDYSWEADEVDTEEDAYFLTVKIPEEVKDKNNVVVYLDNVFCADGKDYSNIIAAKYNVSTTGINGVMFNGGKVAKIYNLNGQLVRKGASLDGLKGVYVVNGKKVVLK